MLKDSLPAFFSFSLSFGLVVVPALDSALYHSEFSLHTEAVMGKIHDAKAVMGKIHDATYM